ncbi:hypothetical protein [Sulfitobacter faviae]|uniref:hypothetical protein n=1 Tax=Sulfitobacter faviae TaxID=1775881 RepID=UPI0024553FA5|nr:hypothetical protein [Sulfitobacter faviae]
MSGHKRRVAVIVKKVKIKGCHESGDKLRTFCHENSDTEKNMDNTANNSRMTVQLPAGLKRHLKVLAAENDRPLSKQVLHCLKVGSGWACEKAEELKNGA